MGHAEMPRELANREARASHLRDLRGCRTALSASRRPQANPRGAKPGAHGSGRDPEARRDPVGPDSGAVRRLQVRVGDPVAGGGSRQSRSLGRREDSSLDEVGPPLDGAADGFGAAPGSLKACQISAPLTYSPIDQVVSDVVDSDDRICGGAM